MYILSCYKDYYDSMAFAYGIDKKVVFNRKSPSINISYGKFDPIIFQCLSCLPKGKYYSNNHTYFEIKVLYFCDEIYYIYEITTYNNDKETIQIGTFINLSDYESIIKSLGYKINLNYFNSRIPTIIDNITSVINKVKVYLEEIYPDIDLPYFTLSKENNSFTIDLPILKNINFNLLKDNDICYQQIEMEMNKKYNIEKTVNIEDKYKLTQYGFDNQSFKKRK